MRLRLIRRPVRNWFLLIAGSIAFTSCTDPVAPDQLVLTTLTVSLPAPTLQVGATANATATGADQNGDPIATGTIAWTSSSGVSVDANGKVTAITAGPATVTATASGVSGDATLTVTPLPASALRMVTSPSVTSPSRTRFTAQPVLQLINANGGDVAQTGVVVTATVSAGGSLTAATATTDATGRATFTDLMLGGLVGNYVLTFAAPGLTSQTAAVALTAGAPTMVQMVSGNQQTAIAGSAVAQAPVVRVTDADGNPVAGAAVIFDVSAGGGTVLGSPATTNANGNAGVVQWTLGSTGTNALLAHLPGNPFGVTFDATATQPPPVLTTLNVSVNPATVVAGGTAQATVVGRDQYGATIATGPITWSASGPATITANGAIQTTAAGQATIIATAGGKTGQATLTITALPVLTTLSVAVQSSTIQTGQSTQATASGKDQFGNTIAVGTVTWSVTGGATISQSGLVTGVSAGTATVRASSGSLNAQTDVVVVPVPNASPVLTSLFVQLFPTTINVGGSSQATVSGVDQYGLPIATGNVVWSATAGASINQSGVINGLAAGTSTIIATSGAVSGQATLTVNAVSQPPVLTGIYVTVAPATIVVGGFAQATAEGRDQYGNYMPVGNVVWTSTPEVTIGNGGAITGVSIGTATITATTGGKSGNASVTVSGAPYLNNLVITVNPKTIGIGDFSQATATGIDQYGNPIAVTGTVEWYADGAAIDQTGRIVGTTVRTAVISAAAYGTQGRRTGQTDIFVVDAAPTKRLLANAPPTITVPNRNTFPVTPVVQVVNDADGQPVLQAGIAITATLTRGIGTLIGGPTTVMTDATGKATFTGLAPAMERGSGNIITFTAPDAIPATWTFNVGSGSVPTGIILLSGDNQTAPSGRPAPNPIRAKVVDPEGNGVNGVTVNFAVTAGGGSIERASVTPNGTAGGDGVADAGSWRMGSVGTNTLTATAAGLGTVTFTATATAPLVCPPAQTLTIGQSSFGRIVSTTGCTIGSFGTPDPFTGPDVDGTYYYNIFEIDIPAGAAVRFDNTWDFSGTPSFNLYDAAGVLVAVRSLNANPPLSVTNTTGATKRYQLLIVTHPGSLGGRGYYSITPVRTN